MIKKSMPDKDVQSVLKKRSEMTDDISAVSSASNDDTTWFSQPESVKSLSKKKKDQYSFRGKV
jgi:hypothetical protein